MFWDRADLLFATIGAEGRFAAVNPAWTRVLGWTPDELIGRRAVEFIHRDDLERTRATSRPQMSTGEFRIHDFENRYQHKDGSVRWLQWSGYERDGIWYASARDVTATRISHGALQASERRSRAILAALREGLLIIGPDRRIVEVSDSFAQMVGFTARELVGIRPPYPWWPPEDDEIKRAPPRGEEPQLRSLELEFRRRDGSRFTALIDEAPLAGPPGTRTSTLLVIRDLTELVDTRARLEEAHQVARLSSWEWHTDGRAVIHYDGMRPDMPPRYETTTDRVLAILTPESRERARRMREELTDGTSEEFVGDMQINSAEFAAIEWVEWRVRPLKAPDGTVIGVRGTAQDITARKRAELVAQRAQQTSQS
ncbi:MAG: PAS domain S-box protein, partial [Solirubrobacteraceae bacterium]|nr:PAS domain S-box protein [Solirubrobacteraceae bacterium]